MSLFRVFVDGQLFYHPHLSQLSITEAKVQEDAENIDSLTLSAPFNHPYLFAIRPMASTIVCKKDELTVLRVLPCVSEGHHAASIFLSGATPWTAGAVPLRA